MQKLMFAVLLITTACGDDPVQYSAPVGIELKAKSGDVVNMTVDADKGITTESGNPYGAFVTDAKARLGRDPGNVELDKLTLSLGAQSTNVTGLDQVLTGDVDVAFLMNDSNNTYDVAHFMNPTGVGPVAVSSVPFDYAGIADQDVGKFLGGGFKVVLRGPAAADFQSKGAEASLQLTFTFTAFE